MELLVNGVLYQLEIDPDTPLLWVLNEQLGLTGTKYSCGIAECGACTVHIDGEAALSCTISVGEVQGREVTTIEGFEGALAEALHQAWEEEDVPQCGYCQPGQIMTAAALLASNKKTGDSDINSAMSGVLCRCGTYPGIRRAVHLAAKRSSS